MKKKYFSVPAIIMTIALCCFVLAGCGSTKTLPAEQASPTDAAKPTATAAAKPDAVTSASYDTGSSDSGKPTTYDIGNADNSAAAVSDAASCTDIGTDEAKKIALEHAGVTPSAVTFTKTEKSCDDKGWEYELVFCSESNRYDYEIDAATGTIRSYGHTPGHYSNLTTGTSNEGNYIDIDTAKAIALEHAGLSEADVTFTKAEPDTDHGRKEFEFKFRCNGTEYEYTIDAASGDIIEFESEHNH